MSRQYATEQQQMEKHTKELKALIKDRADPPQRGELKLGKKKPTPGKLATQVGPKPTKTEYK